MAGGASPARVLVVEDDPTVGPLIVTILEAAGYFTVLTSSFKSAVAAADESEFDLVLCDLVLGAQDGHDVSDTLRARKPRLPVVFMSGYGGSRYGQDPSDPVLAKPFIAAELVARIEKALATRD